MCRTFLTILLVFIFTPCFSENINLKIHHWETSITLPTNTIVSISQDSVGFILLECADGWYRFNGKSSQPIKPINSIQKNSKHVQLQEGRLIINENEVGIGITSFIENSANEIWVSGSLGLGIVDDEKQTINWHKDAVNLPEQTCFNLAEAPGGKVWFSMSLTGIGFYEPINGKLFTLKNISEYPTFSNGHHIFSELLDYDITSLFFDNGGSLWISTRNKGLFKISFAPQPYQFFRFEYKQTSELVHRDISYPLATESGDVWISTWGGGINIWKKDELEAAIPNFKSIPLVLENNKPIPDLRIFPLLEDSRKNIWFGTETGGLFRLSADNRKKKQYNYEVYNTANGSLPNDSVTALCKGLGNDIWCGTYSGLVQINSALKSRTEFPELENPDVFKNIPISMVKLASNKKLWVASRNNTLYLWDLKTNQISVFYGSNNEPFGFLLNHAMVNEIDWFAGFNGLFYYDKASQTIEPFKNNHLLPGRHAESLLSDNRGKLWVGSAAGLIKIDPLNDELIKYNFSGGRLGSSFTQGASKDSNGFLYFGSRYGFYRFYPENLEYKTPVTPIVFTAFTISGVNFSIDSLARTKKWKTTPQKQGFVKLKHKENSIAIDYLNLNYSNEAASTFEILLEGIDADWIETSDTRRTWNGLKPGSYVFKVKEKGRNNTNELRFEILQPWWTTVPAFITYFLFIVLLFVVMYRAITVRAKEKEKQRQKEKFDRLRFRFFLNISHEIRTPLTLIKGAIDRLLETENKTENRELHRIKKNTNRLIRMVNEVLDLKKIENTELEVKNTYFNLKDFLESTVDAFRLREDKCTIELTVPELPVWINTARDLLETILYNLLSNAIKFSPDKSTIKITLSQHNESCKISVQDFGIGIKEKEQQQIFNRFYKSENNANYGAGIGLSLVQEFVQLLNGEILVDSTPEVGSIFTVTLPMASEYKQQKSVEINSEERPLLLVVDDHSDIRHFVMEIFEGSFKCLEAENGKVALEMIENTLPDFVISDVMMPVMNGFQLCQILKGNIKTSHIPLILLTAKTEFEAELEATECNAEAFVAKPFNEKLLKLKVEKILDARKRLWDSFQHSIKPQEEETLLNSMDKEFIEKLENCILTEIDNSGYSVDELAGKLALSSSGLYRKIKALSGQSPVEFVRGFRLKKAALMLKETAHSITEISDMTGFGTQKYFSRCFKEKFGASPLNYRKSCKN